MVVYVLLLDAREEMKNQGWLMVADDLSLAKLASVTSSNFREKARTKNVGLSPSDL
jgi:hypothetical protein